MGDYCEALEEVWDELDLSDSQRRMRAIVEAYRDSRRKIRSKDRKALEFGDPDFTGTKHRSDKFFSLYEVAALYGSLLDIVEKYEAVISELECKNSDLEKKLDESDISLRAKEKLLGRFKARCSPETYRFVEDLLGDY